MLTPQAIQRPTKDVAGHLIQIDIVGFGMCNRLENALYLPQVGGCAHKIVCELPFRHVKMVQTKTTKSLAVEIARTSAATPLGAILRQSRMLASIVAWRAITYH